MAEVDCGKLRFSTRSIESCEESTQRLLLRREIQCFSTRSIESCEESNYPVGWLFPDRVSVLALSSRVRNHAARPLGGLWRASFSTRSIESCEESQAALYDAGYLTCFSTRSIESCEESPRKMAGRG